MRVHERGRGRAQSLDGHTRCQDWWALCKHIHRHEGWHGFFRGFAFNTYGGIPGQLAFLITYNSCKEKVENVAGDSPVAPLVAGAMAEGLTAGFWVPLDVIVQRVQIQGGLPPGWNGGALGGAHVPSVQQGGFRPVFKGALGVIKDIVREDGVAGLWRGMGAHLVSFMPQAAIWWASFEESKSLLARRAPDSWQGMPCHFLAGVSAGVVNSVVTNPLDTMKVRVQTKIGAGSSAWSCLRGMVRAEGLSSLGLLYLSSTRARPVRARRAGGARRRRARCLHLCVVRGDVGEEWVAGVRPALSRAVSRPHQPRACRKGAGS